MDNIANGVYKLANCSECCVMLSRGHYLAIYETLSYLYCIVGDGATGAKQTEDILDTT